MKFSSKTKTFGSILLTSAILGLLLYLSNPAEALSNISSANPLLLFLAALTANTPLLIYAYVWQKIFGILKINLSYFENLRLLMVNVFINNITPFGNIGGEVVTTYILSKEISISSGKIFSGLLTASIVNFAPLITLLIIGSIVTGYWHIITVLAIFSLISKLLLNYRPKLSSRIEGFISDFGDSLSIIKRSWKKILPLIGITHMGIFFDTLSIALIGLSFGFNLFTPELLLIIPLARLANYFPTPGGSGPYEVALAGLLSGFIGIKLSQGVLIAVTYRVLTYYVGILIGYLAINSVQIKGVDIM